MNMPSGNPTPPHDPAPNSALRTSFGHRLLAVGGWICLIVALSLWGLLRAGDLWGWATIVMFAPLYLLVLLPTALLAAAALFHRRALRPLIPALLVTAGPVAGFCVPWNRLTPEPPTGPRLRVLTCNMHHAKVAAAPLDRLIDETGPEVVALQEWNDKNRSEVLAGPEWHVRRAPGLFLASRHPIRRAERLGTNSVDDRGSVARYELDTPAGIVTIFSVHLASPREGLGEVAKGDTVGLNEIVANSELRWTQSRNLATEAGRTTGPVLLLGDFNTPPHSAIFRHVWGGYEDAFASAGWGWGRTFSARLSSVRIDHILVGGGGRALECRVGPYVGSPHRPVFADVAWPTPAPEVKPPAP